LVPTNSSASLHYLAFTLNSNGDESVRSDTGLTYQPSTNTLATGVVNSTTINATSVSATNVTGTTVFAGTIDNIGDSSGLTPGVTFIPAVTFNSDVTIENELFAGSNIFPVNSESYDLGSYTKKFRKLYLAEGDNALWIGNAAISGSGTAINLPAGSTVGGSAITTAAGSNATTITVNTTGTSSEHFVAFFDAQSGDKVILTDNNFNYNPGTGVFSVGDATIGTVTGNLVGQVTGNVTGNLTGSVIGDLKGSVFADDSTVLVDGPAGVLRGTLVGQLTGNVTGDVTGDVTGIITGTGTGSSLGALTTTNTTVANSFGTTNVVSNTYSSTVNLFAVSQAHATADARNVAFVRSRGTITAPSIVQNGDDLVDISFVGYGTNTYISGAVISVTIADTAPSNTSMKTRMAFSSNNGAGGLQENIAIEATGQLTVNRGLSTGSIQLIENNINGTNSNEDIVINPSGTGTVDFTIVEQSTVGSSGVASPLPATPSTYFKIKLNGVEYVVPAYAVS
jgi:hypothetical protein